MNLSSFSISNSQFNRLFPFYIELNESLTIVSYGKSLQKIIPNIENTLLLHNFKVNRPNFESINYNVLQAIANEFILLESTNLPNNIILKGGIEILEYTNHLLFAGTLWLNDLQDLNTLPITQSDFCNSDPTIDFLNVITTKEIVNTDLKQLLITVNNQKNELKNAAIINADFANNLKESNQRYNYVTMATFDAIWDWDLITGNVFWGDSVQEMFGYNQNEMQLNNRFWREHIHPEDRDSIIKSIYDAIESNKNNWDEEYRFLKNDGTYAYVTDRGFVIRNEEGIGTRMVGAIQDITKRKNEEHHLKLLESVITNVKDSILITEAEPFDEPGPKILFVNEAFTKMTGYTAAEVIGKTPRILQGPKSDREELKRLRNALRNWESCEITTINYKKNGEEFWVNFSVSPVKNSNGWFTHWIAIERDVTEQINIAAQISKQKKFWEDILFNIPTDIAVFDKDHNYIFMNNHGVKDDAARKWLIGKNDFDFFKMRGLGDELAIKRRKHFEAALHTKQVVTWIDEHINKQGKIEYKLRNFYPFFEKEQLQFVIGYGIDITERKQAEVKLNQALVQMQKSNDELEQFAYVASHDLQEPLRMIASFLNLLSLKFNSELDEDAKKYVNFAVNGATRMQQIITDLLEFSKVGKTEDKLELVNLDELVAEILTLQSRHIEEKAAVINIATLPTVLTFKAPIRQVFQNLINNSLKYCKDDVPPNLNITYQDKNTHWQFTLTDNGIGIDEQYFEKIFIIFQRLHSRDKFSGTGIGLAITKKIIENLGGNIWLTSQKNIGSTFYFTIAKKSENNFEI